MVAAVGAPLTALGFGIGGGVAVIVMFLADRLQKHVCDWPAHGRAGRVRSGGISPRGIRPAGDDGSPAGV